MVRYLKPIESKESPRSGIAGREDSLAWGENLSTLLGVREDSQGWDRPTVMQQLSQL